MYVYMISVKLIHIVCIYIYIYIYVYIHSYIILQVRVSSVRRHEGGFGRTPDSDRRSLPRKILPGAKQIYLYPYLYLSLSLYIYIYVCIHNNSVAILAQAILAQVALSAPAGMGLLAGTPAR